MNYSDRFTPEEIEIFNQIFDLLDSLYKQPNPDNVEIDRLYRRIVDAVDSYGTCESSEEGCLNEEFKIEPMTIREFLNEFDFDVYRTHQGDEIVYKLKDLQNANLGNIEDETFYDIGHIIGRLDIYYRDYFLDDVEFQLDDVAAANNDESIVEKWYDLDDYEVMYNYLINIENKYCSKEDCSTTFDRAINYLHYIVHPEDLVDDTEIED